ncbi:STAS domain-containing protein [Streptomyces sp. HSW2009]|uniref:STAS domain-containing protein n=1 Tax=Streptomyces sp. HSW2009 TaxID=3142890 RepID=UPI0032EC6DB6
MTIEWRYRSERHLGLLSVAGYLGPHAAHRFTGAIGWALARGTGPIIVDLTELRGWSAEGQLAIVTAAHQLALAGRTLALAAIPADGSLVPHPDAPTIPVHPDLPTAITAHAPSSTADEQAREWRTAGWEGE